MEYSKGTAYLGNEGRYSVFIYGEERLKFIAPYSLEKYIDVLEWDKGYLVVMAKYAHNEYPEEEYIDLRPILDILLIDKEQFLSGIQKVEVLK